MILFEDEDFIITKSETDFKKNVIFLNSAAGLDRIGTGGLIVNPAPHRGDKPIAGIYLQAECNEINFFCKNASWYQRKSITECLDALRACVASADKSIMYGFSMGGFGAIHLAPELEIPAVAFSPQATLDPGFPMLPDWLPSYEKALADFGSFNSNIISGKCADSQIYLFYDSRQHLDYQHARYIIKNCPNCQHFNIPFAGHACSGVVNYFYHIKNIILEILSGSFEKKKFTASIFSRYDPVANFKFNGYKFFSYLLDAIVDREFGEFLKRLERKEYKDVLIAILHKVEASWPDRVDEVLDLIVAKNLAADSPPLQEADGHLAGSSRICRETVAIFCYNRKRYAEAASLYASLHAEYPLQGSHLHNFVHSLENTGHKNEALELLNKLLAINPLDWQALKVKSQYYIRAKNFQEARKVLSVLRRLNFTPEICIIQAQSYRFANNFPEAIRCLERNYARFSNSGNFLSHLGCYLCLSGDYAKGMEQLELARTKKDYPAWVNGWILDFRKKHPDAPNKAPS